MGAAEVGCDVSFAEWTSDGQRKNATDDILGLRLDKSPKEGIRSRSGE